MASTLDHKLATALAAHRAGNLLEAERLYREVVAEQPNSADAWHLLTGDEETIRRVTSAAGFFYKWDEASGQFAHVSGVLVATPEGRLSRYFYGVEFSPRDLRLALVESGDGKIGSAIDELFLYCFHYDPESGQYGVVVMNLIRLGGALTVLEVPREGVGEQGIDQRPLGPA